MAWPEEVSFLPSVQYKPWNRPNLVLVFPVASFPCCHYPVAQQSGDRPACLPSKKFTEETVTKAGTCKGKNNPYIQRSQNCQIHTLYMKGMVIATGFKKSLFLLLNMNTTMYINSIWKHDLIFFNITAYLLTWIDTLICCLRNVNNFW